MRQYCENTTVNKYGEYSTIVRSPVKDDVIALDEEQRRRSRAHKEMRTEKCARKYRKRDSV